LAEELVERLAEKLDINTIAIDKNISILKKKGLLKRVGSASVHVHRPPVVTLNATPEEFHISIGLR